jgi:hypothetical protein
MQRMPRKNSNDGLGNGDLGWSDGGWHLPRITVVERGSKSFTLERSDTLRQGASIACS